MAYNIGGLIYQKQFVSGPERRVDKPGSQTGEHSYHSSYTLPNGAIMEAVVTGVLKGVIRVDETQKLLILGPPLGGDAFSGGDLMQKIFTEQEDSLEVVPRAEHDVKQRIIVSETRWCQKDTIIVNTSALTIMSETAIGDPTQVTRGTMLGAQIGNLMRCRVVLQRQDQCRSVLSNGVHVYDRTYRLKANATERIYDKSDLLYF